MASLNTAFHTGDEYSCVRENRRRFLEPWGFHPDEVVAAVQVHGGQDLPGLRRRSRARRRPQSFLGEGDALVTAVPDLPLTGYAADCLLLFFAAPDVPAVALAHSGWRGTLQNMARRWWQICAFALVLILRLCWWRSARVSAAGAILLTEL